MRSTLTLLTFLVFSSNLHAIDLLTVKELKKELDQTDQTLILLDVRTIEEFNSGRIKNSINIPHDLLLSDISLISDYKNEKVVVYCRSGKRAKIVLDRLSDEGFSTLIDIDGDMLAWNIANLPIEKE
ncbi:MAG: rhodanese-like domain-containing protein [Gammaproteobacteria bacterium]|jgi:rhodanese-related sulfurtransferase|nr:rhodanese-like domain-containing protein [Gammaproteobacteria bacterium]|tara:strand:+ start:1798 stop:2178 length:381 start_codon:yes stop_codon:yes gene_type:complete